MSTATYRAGIIGLGFIGGADQASGDAIGQVVANLDGTHAEALSRHPRVRLVAGSSRDAGRRERFAARTGARTYADWQELLEQEALDVVSVATYARRTRRSRWGAPPGGCGRSTARSPWPRRCATPTACSRPATPPAPCW
jgi:hypothetical protein